MESRRMILPLWEAATRTFPVTETQWEEIRPCEDAAVVVAADVVSADAVAVAAGIVLAFADAADVDFVVAEALFGTYL